MSLQDAAGIVDSLLALGRDVSDVGSWPMIVRTIVIYAFTLLVVRLSSPRLLSKASPFDVIVSIMLGSIMSRAINGSAPFGPTLAAGAALLGMHALFARIAVQTSWFGTLVKGRRVRVIENGRILDDGLHEAGLTRADLEQALRLEAKEDDPSRIGAAYIERNGKISVVP